LKKPLVLVDAKKKRFDRENCNSQGLIVLKAKRERRQDRKKPAVPRMNLLCLG
jgi:hypothetical protein